jgi:hypothetical protein
MIALDERDRDEGLPGRGLLGDGAHLLGVDPHRLLHQERIAAVEQVVGRLRHPVVRTEGDHEVRSRLRQHLAVVGEHRRVAEYARPFGCDRRALIL